MLTFGFFDSVDGDRKYSADDISNFYLGLIPSGVLARPENSLQVIADSENMSVRVAAGYGFIRCKWAHNNADMYLDIDESDIVLNRCDRIVLRLNSDISARNIEIAVRKALRRKNLSCLSYSVMKQCMNSVWVWFTYGQDVQP